MEALEHIHVFKTNLGKLCSNCETSRTLNALSEILEWSLDVEDCDRVLRVVSQKLKPHTIATIITSLGFECTELP